MCGPAWADVDVPESPEQAQLQHICYDRQVAAVPVGREPVAPSEPPTDINQLPVEVDARTSQVSSKTEEAKFSGGVTVRQGERLIEAEEVIYNRSTGQFEAPGAFYLRDSNIELSGKNLILKSEESQASLEDAYYQLPGQPGRGGADILRVESRTVVSMEEAHFTTCPPQQPSWQVSAKRIVLDKESGRGRAYGALFRVRDVPIVPLPYFNFPIDDRRQSGFLMPSVGTSSEDGFKLRVPYYFNILPNLDLVLAPHLMTDRGLKLETETRYLLPEQQGRVIVEYLNKDDKYDIDDRHLFYISHQGSWGPNWRGSAEYYDVSDANYFNDMDAQVSGTTDTYLNRSAQVGYYQDNWNARMRLQGFQSLGKSLTEDGDEVSRLPYSMLPQFELEWREPSGWLGLDYSIDSELVAFDAEDTSRPDALRLHIEPGITLPLNSPFGSLVAEAKLLQTWYNQKLPDASSFDENSAEGKQIAQLDENVSRTLPQLRLYGKVNFERDFQLYQKPWLQTLEPAFQYLYIPEEDQSDIFAYDTTAIDYSYDALFRPRSFSGIDRIASANQFTLGATTRLLDQANRERLRFSLGQIFRLDSRRVGDDKLDSQSSLATEFYWQPKPSWAVESQFQYNTNRSETEKNYIRLNYNPDDARLVGISYRYTRGVRSLQNTELPEEDLEQIGGQLAWPLWRPEYKIFSSYYWSLDQDRENEALFGLKYDSCCWAVSVLYSKQLNTILDENSRDQGRDTYNEGVSLSLTIKGLGSDRSTTERLLNKSIFTRESSVNLLN